MCYRNFVRYSCEHFHWHTPEPFTLCENAQGPPIKRQCANVQDRTVHVSAYLCPGCVPKMYNIYGNYIGGSGGNKDNVPQ